jgi:hypothetical protein
VQTQVMLPHWDDTFLFKAPIFISDMVEKKLECEEIGDGY